MTQKISLIVPLRLTASTFEGPLRLQRLCQAVPRDLFDIVIADYGTQEVHAEPLRKLEKEDVQIYRHPSPAKLFSIGHARDFGVQMARQDVILFNDIDFLATPAMYRQIHAEVMRRDMARNIFDFFCVPVLFLTEQGTRAWFGAQSSGTPFVEQFSVQWLEKNEATIQFTAFGSSAMVINRHHYLSLGGHDRRFRGHGAEDYDLLHRLSSLAPKAPRPHDYYTDYRTNSVRQYWGFRPFFALYGLGAFARELQLVHLWHPRRNEKGYFRSRPNFRLLRKIMRDFDRMGKQPQPLPDLHAQGNIALFSAYPEAGLRVFRQLLAAAGAFSIHRYDRRGGVEKAVALSLQDKAGWLVLHLENAAASPPLEDLIKASGRLNVLAGWIEDGRLFVRHWAGGAEQAAISSRIDPAYSHDGKLVMERIEQIAIPGLCALSSGTVPPMESPDAMIFDTFGGASAFDPTGQRKPRRPRKTAIATRVYRWLTRR